MNNYLTLAAEAGIPALILYLICIFMACRIAHKNILLNTKDRGFRIGMLCGVYSMLIFALTTYTMGRVYANVLVWSSLGYLAVLPEEEDSSLRSE